jgi:hypothetical protein
MPMTKAMHGGLPMPVARSRWLDRTLFGLGFALLHALSWPGVEARADQGMAPSARDLTALNPRAAAVPMPASAGASCNANAPLVDPQRAADQRAAMQRLAQAVHGDGAVVMNGRGYAYETETDPTLELMRIQLEARAASPPE